MTSYLRRREFITLLGGAAVVPSLLCPRAARAQQPAFPVVGFLHSGAAEPNAKRLAGFRKGLNVSGFVENQNVAIEFRWAAGQDSRLPELAADLIRRQVAVIATPSSTDGALAAKAATTTIPIVFTTANDPVRLGLVASLNRPGGNATGISSLNTELTAKRLGLVRELVPQAARLGLLVNTDNVNAEAASKELMAAAVARGMQIEVVGANDSGKIEAAFAAFVRNRTDALLIGADPLLFSRRVQLATLAARHAIPAIYNDREFADSGGLMSYGTSTVGTWEQAGIYVARVLKGEKPADLPVAQATKFEMVINLNTAKALGLAIPNTLLALADEVIE